MLAKMFSAEILHFPAEINSAEIFPSEFFPTEILTNPAEIISAEIFRSSPFRFM